MELGEHKAGETLDGHRAGKTLGLGRRRWGKGGDTGSRLARSSPSLEMSVSKLEALTFNHY